MSVRILIGDVRERLRDLADESVHCIVTSPPYFGLRDYGHPGQIGLEPTPAEFVETMVHVFREARRVLRPDGTLWLNLGDSYVSHDPGGYREGEFLNPEGRQSNASKGARNKAGTYVSGIKRKNLIGIPWRVAFALQADGWWLRQDIIWHKSNPMPESVTDRCTKAHEYLFLLSKSARYWYDAEAVAEPVQPSSVARYGYAFGGAKSEAPATRNRRSVWSITSQPYDGAHFATMPPALIEPCIKAGCPEGGTVLDPFGGAGTTGLVADRLRRNAVLIELNPAYATMAARRIEGEAGMFSNVRVEEPAPLAHQEAALG